MPQKLPPPIAGEVQHEATTCPPGMTRPVVPSTGVTALPQVAVTTLAAVALPLQMMIDRTLGLEATAFIVAPVPTVRAKICGTKDSGCALTRSTGSHSTAAQSATPKAAAPAALMNETGSSNFFIAALLHPWFHCASR